jgi:hypothetical protein
VWWNRPPTAPPVGALDERSSAKDIMDEQRFYAAQRSDLVG